MRYGRKQGFLVAGVLLMAAVGCQEQKSPEPVTARPQGFEEALMLGEIHPMADGTAYLASFSGLFYVHGSSAEMVTGLPPEGFGELTALADGTALYLLSFSEQPRLFRLRGATASPVVEGDVSEKARGSVRAEGFLFAENQRLRKRISELSSELAAFEER